MYTKRITSFIILSLFLINFAFAGTAGLKSLAQKEELKKLSPKYRAFLAETREFMHSEERKVFMQLETDRERDVFIREFWKARKGWDNISTLYLLRMVQVLDLKEDQAARIFPVVNRVEKEKREKNRKIGLLLRDIRAILRQQDGNEEELAPIVQEIKVLRERIISLDDELGESLAENLSVRQQAKYLIFVQDFLKDLREKLSKAREAIK